MDMGRRGMRHVACPSRAVEDVPDPLEEAVEFRALSPLAAPPILLAGRIEFK